MKKVKSVSLGDKVFAKVKGYPAWPARVDEDLGKKYKVYFYGTGETGTVKAEDLFPYVEFKEQFFRSLKRKDYNDAIEEIEAAIAEDVAVIEQPVEPKHEEKKEPEPKTGVKRKFSTDSTSTESSAKKKANAAKQQMIATVTITKDEAELCNAKSAATQEEAKPAKTDPTNDSPNKDNQIESISEFDKVEDAGSEEKANDHELRTPRKQLMNRQWEEDLQNTDSVSDKKSGDSAKFKVVTPQCLRDIIEEFEKYVSDAEMGNEKPDETKDSPKEILLTRLSPTKFIGIKLNQNRPSEPFETELERLRWKESDARTALELKDKIESDLLKPEDKPERFEFDLNLTEEQLNDALRYRISERKRSKLKYLKIETTLLELDTAIKTNLALDKASPKDALKEMDAILELNVEALMLKKHSAVMVMVRRLRRYIGNVKEWKLEGDSLEEFKKDAKKIRDKADVIYNKFKSLFKIPEEKSFWETFDDECAKFKSLTKDLTEEQCFMLCAEPGTKQSSWDEYDAEEQRKMNADDKNVNNKEKLKISSSDKMDESTLIST